MSEEIKVGDLAIVVKATPCCGNTTPVGRVVSVVGLMRRSGRCFFCGKVDAESLKAKLDDRVWIQVDRLKKIEPLGESDAEVTSDELTTSS